VAVGFCAGLRDFPRSDRRELTASAGLGPAAGVVAEEDGFDEAADEVLFVGVEVLGGFEL